MKAFEVDKTDTERDHSAAQEQSLFIWTISLFSFEEHVSWLGIVRRVRDSCVP